VDPTIVALGTLAAAVLLLAVAWGLVYTGWYFAQENAAAQIKTANLERDHAIAEWESVKAKWVADKKRWLASRVGAQVDFERERARSEDVEVAAGDDDALRDRLLRRAEERDRALAGEPSEASDRG